MIHHLQFTYPFKFLQVSQSQDGKAAVVNAAAAAAEKAAERRAEQSQRRNEESQGPRYSSKNMVSRTRVQFFNGCLPIIYHDLSGAFSVPVNTTTPDVDHRTTAATIAAAVGTVVTTSSLSILLPPNSKAKPVTTSNTAFDANNNRFTTQLNQGDCFGEVCMRGFKVQVLFTLLSPIKHTSQIKS